MDRNGRRIPTTLREIGLDRYWRTRNHIKFEKWNVCPALLNSTQLWWKAWIRCSKSLQAVTDAIFLKEWHFHQENWALLTLGGLGILERSAQPQSPNFIGGHKLEDGGELGIFTAIPFLRDHFTGEEILWYSKGTILIPGVFWQISNTIRTSQRPF